MKLSGKHTAPTEEYYLLEIKEPTLQDVCLQWALIETVLGDPAKLSVRMEGHFTDKDGETWFTDRGSFVIEKIENSHVTTTVDGIKMRMYPSFIRYVVFQYGKLPEFPYPD